MQNQTSNIQNELFKIFIERACYSKNIPGLLELHDIGAKENMFPFGLNGMDYDYTPHEIARFSGPLGHDKSRLLKEKNRDVIPQARSALLRSNTFKAVSECFLSVDWTFFGAFCEVSSAVNVIKGLVLSEPFQFTGWEGEDWRFSTETPSIEAFNALRLRVEVEETTHGAHYFDVSAFEKWIKNTHAEHDELGFGRQM